MPRLNRGMINKSVADTGKAELLQAGNRFENPFSSPVVARIDRGG